MNRRVWLLIGALGIILIAVAAWFSYRVQRSLVPELVVPDAPQIVTLRGDEPDLSSTVLVEGLSNVWDVGFLPDTTLLFTERSGSISKLMNGKKQIIHAVDGVEVKGEGGLMGLVVDPDFANNRFVYACYNTNNDIRVSRWEVNNNATGLTNQTEIVTGMPTNKTTFPGRHSGCRPRFGADGNLWIGTGDVANGINPQDPTSLGGKILRVTRDGKPVSGNLRSPYDSRIFSYGHRNTQGLAMLRAIKNDNYGYSVEHGTGRDDEVNQLITGNFGYNPVPGYNESVAMTDKQKYPSAIDAVWSSGSSTIAPSGATIINGANWKSFDGALAMAVLKDKYLHIFTFDEKDKINGEKKFFSGEFGRLRSVVMGPFDRMYLTTDNGAQQDSIIEIKTE